MQYIYLMLYKIPVDILTSSASRALGSVIAKFKTFKDVDFDTFNKKNHSMVVPITDSCLNVCGYGNFTKTANILNRQISYFLGVYNKAPLVGFQGEENWITPRYRSHLCKIRFLNRLIQMDNTRLTKKVLKELLSITCRSMKLSLTLGSYGGYFGI